MFLAGKLIKVGINQAKKRKAEDDANWEGMLSRTLSYRPLHYLRPSS